MEYLFAVGEGFFFFRLATSAHGGELHTFHTTKYASRIYDLDGLRMKAFQVGQLVSAEFGVNQNGAVLVLLI